MAKPLSTFDYLIDKKSKPETEPRPAQAPMPQHFPNLETADRLSEAWAALAMPILLQLQSDPSGKQTMFQLVERQKISVDDLRPVLDLMANRHNWITLDKNDLKGDWAVSLTSRGRDYVKLYAR